MPRYFSFFFNRYGYGSWGDDTFVASNKNDKLFGGFGTDTVHYSSSVFDAHFVSLGSTFAIVQSGDGSTDTLYGIENLQFNDYIFHLDGTNNAVLAKDDTLSGVEDTPITASYASLTANDFDGDGDALQVTDVISLSGGTITLGNDGFTFVPAENFTGEAVLQYTVTDGNGSVTTAEIIVTVEPGPNEAPVAGNDMVDASAGTQIVYTAQQLLLNDTDPDGDPLLIVSISNVVGGQAQLVDGDVFFFADVDSTGSASFDYLVSDGEGGFDTATVDIDVSPIVFLASDDFLFA